jgi:hypothetical protein
MIITKASGEKVQFDRKKYERSLKRAGLTMAEAKKVSNQVYQDLYPEIPSEKIYQRTHQVLRKKDKVLAAKYSLKRAIMELGPGGYYFERYMAAVLKEYGYQTKFNQFVFGKCVEHEVDIIAEKNGKRYMIECKYHIRKGQTSDLKVALYTYARFLDLRNNQNFKEVILITNTRCTSEAVKYARCARFKIIGWNYPNQRESLQHYVESKNLYPVTVLYSLNNHLKRRFRDAGIILAADLLKFTPERLAKRFRVKESLARRLIDEAAQLRGV